ncbi:hypothetical protein ACFWB0_06000 [Rhodococcus sp. NPDC060086]|uniref:AMP-binding enzyme n=1 Tax=Rhodococcus sp. NPDC060086 TaxID=3347055 RepID=UPI00365AFB96
MTFLRRHLERVSTAQISPGVDAVDLEHLDGRGHHSVEVENALAGHPDVLDVAIVSRLDETFGGTIVAVVTPTEGRAAC